MSEYAEREPWDLEPHYIKHVSAMTAEGLHSKAAIAAELAYRDQRIAELEKQLAAHDAKVAAEAKAEARWIPCDEQMPDLIGRDDSHVPGGAPATLYSERVLVFDGTVRIDNLVQAEGSPETRTFYVGSHKPVTHWMPLPEPPEAIREEQEGK